MGFVVEAEAQIAKKPEIRAQLEPLITVHFPVSPPLSGCTAHRRRNAAAEARSPETPRPVAATLRCKGTTLRVRFPSHPSRPSRRPGPRRRRPWLLRPPLQVPSPPPDAADDRSLCIRARPRQARRLRTRDPHRKHLLVLLAGRCLDPVFPVLLTRVLVVTDAVWFFSWKNWIYDTERSQF